VLRRTKKFYRSGSSNDAIPVYQRVPSNTTNVSMNDDHESSVVSNNDGPEFSNESINDIPDFSRPGSMIIFEYNLQFLYSNETCIPSQTILGPICLLLQLIVWYPR